MTPMNIKPEASDAAEYDTCPCVYLNDALHTHH